MSSVSSDQSEAETVEGSDATEATSAGSSQASEKCIVTGFTAKQKKKLLKSWNKMKGQTQEQLHALGLNLVLWMMVEVPEMKKLFHKFNAYLKEEELKNDQVFVDHTVRLIKLLDELVTHLPDPENFTLIAQKMCTFHLNITPPAGSTYFEPFRDKFHLFLRHYPDLEADDEDIELWTEFFNVICQIVKSEEAKLPPSEKVSGKGCCSTL